MTLESDRQLFDYYLNRESFYFSTSVLIQYKVEARWEMERTLFQKSMDKCIVSVSKPWLKFHTTTLSLQKARKICQMEQGTTLFPNHSFLQHTKVTNSKFLIS